MMMRDDGLFSSKRKKSKRLYNVLRILLIILCIIPVILDIVWGKNYYVYNREEIVRNDPKEDSYWYLDEITDDIHIKQTFLCTTDSLVSINLSCATYARVNTGKIGFILVDETDETIIESWEFDTAEIKDNSNILLVIEKENRGTKLQGHTCRIDMETKGAYAGNAITLYYLTDDYYPDGYLSINDNIESGDLAMTITGRNIYTGYNRVRYWFCFYCLFIILIIFSCVGRKYVERRK